MSPGQVLGHMNSHENNWFLCISSNRPGKHLEHQVSSFIICAYENADKDDGVLGYSLLFERSYKEQQSLFAKKVLQSIFGSLVNLSADIK